MLLESPARVELHARSANDPFELGLLVFETRLAPAAVRLAGVWHAAGVLSDAMVAGHNGSTLVKVYGPKAHGAWLLHTAFAECLVKGCTFFSSIAALMGTPPPPKKKPAKQPPPRLPPL